MTPSHLIQERPTSSKQDPEPRHRPRISGLARYKEAVLGTAFIAPAGLILIVFWLLPLLLVVIFSFFHWTAGTNPKFDGVTEFHTVLSSNLFWHSLVITIVFAAATVILGVIISLALALLVHTGLHASGMFRAIYFLPYVTPIVATSTVWLWIYQPNVGILDRMFGLVGLSSAIAWMSYPKLALLGLVIYTIWYTFGFTTLLFLAGLNNIPQTTMEAAHIDGATPWQRYRWVILPLLTPTTLFVIEIDTISAFQAFTQVYALTHGGPINGTTTLTYLIYELSFQYFHFGQASAAATVFVILVGLLVLLQFRIARRSTAYQI